MKHLAIIYDSKTGTTKQAANWIAEGMQAIGDAEAKCFSIPDVDLAFVHDADCVILGAPTYFASLPGTMKAWLETHAKGLGLAGKLGGAFATEQYIHGGGETTISELLTFELCCGMAVYSGGSSFGAPFIHLGPIGLSGDIENFHKLFQTYGKRFATFNTQEKMM